jgi:hypothetical protein
MALTRAEYKAINGRYKNKLGRFEKKKDREPSHIERRVMWREAVREVTGR